LQVRYNTQAFEPKIEFKEREATPVSWMMNFFCVISSVSALSNWKGGVTFGKSLTAVKYRKRTSLKPSQFTSCSESKLL